MNANCLCRYTATLSFKASSRFLSRLWLSHYNNPHTPARVIRAAEGPHALYVHIPFCHKPICLFCCFVKTIYDKKTYSRYMELLGKELENIVSIADRAKIMEIYIGGGTPTVDIHGLLEFLDKARTAAGKIPISLEAHPLDIDEDNALLLKRSGVERLSIGVQSFQKWKLRQLGRFSHTIEDSYRAVHAASKVFQNLNIDIVWGLRREKPENTYLDAVRAFELKPGQVTFYPLMPPPTRAWKKPWIHPLEYEMYQAILLAAEKHGYKPATPWCMNRWSKMVDEYVIDYTSFLAIGVSGIGRTRTHAYLNAFSLNRYEKLVEKQGLGIARVLELNRLEDWLYEFSIRIFDATLALHRIRGVLGLDRRALATLASILAKKLAPLPERKVLFLSQCMQKGIYTGVNLLRRWGMRSTSI